MKEAHFSHLLGMILVLLSAGGLYASDPNYLPPASERTTYDMNRDWRFIRADAPGSENPDFDDSRWQVISTPHTYNDVDTFNKIISHSGGQAGAYMGPAWYRKHFKLPVAAKNQKAYLEFEGMRQAGQVYLNGKAVGLYENGVTAYGIDITGIVHTGEDENVLAVRVDNSNYKEKTTGTEFEWESKDFNPNYGGINRHVWLHVTGKIHQTLPLYYGLQTTGIYVHADSIESDARTAEIHVESQLINESGEMSKVTLSAVIVDSSGRQVTRLDQDATSLKSGETSVFKVAGKANGLQFWSPETPVLYDVYTILTVDQKVIDVVKTVTGFRKVEFRGGAGKGGVFINGRFCYLKGYAQRSTDEWAGVGQAYPDWMHDLTAKMIRDSHANYVRWMHISPQRTDVESCDKYGIVEVCPAGDKEKDVEGRQWQQRMDVMRDSIIYYRNNPSILFWEAGNNGISADHMKQMVDLKQAYDPEGGRAMGCRSLTDPGTTNLAQYYGVMVGQDDSKDKRRGPTDMFRSYSDQRRDLAPLIEAEDFRDEGARRFWDGFSPPHFGFKPGPKDTYHWNSETFALAQVGRYWDYYSNRISNSDPKHSKWSGYASIYFSDSNADGRQDSSEVCRVSGKVDAVRLPKEVYFVERVIQNPKPDIHILGHWTYPAGTKKTIYVVSNCDEVELNLNGKVMGRSSHPTDGYVFAFPDITFMPGELNAVGINKRVQACEQILKTAGEPTAIKLTAINGPGGLLADGADVSLFDVEVIDDRGQRCPTDEARIDFKIDGPGIWRGGYNSGIVDSTNNLFLNTECGINRVSIRSTLSAGPIRLTASRSGLKSATVEVVSVLANNGSGLQVASPRRGLPSPFQGRE